MKIILLVGILFLVFVQGLADQTITCKVKIVSTQTQCTFPDVKIGPNEAISIATDPADFDANLIDAVLFSWSSKKSSVYSVPSEIFSKFPNLERFQAWMQEIEEVKYDTFWNGKNLLGIDLSTNFITFLHRDTFKG
jgi:hypothetical protein